MKKTLLLCAFVLSSLAGMAQRLEKVDVAALGVLNDKEVNIEHVLQQFVLVPTDYLNSEDSEELREKLSILSEQTEQRLEATFSQMAVKQLKEAVVEMEKMKAEYKDQPQYLQMIDENISKLKEGIEERQNMDTNFEPLKYDPQQVLKEIVAISANRKIYSYVEELENGMWKVSEAPRYSDDENDGILQAIDYTYGLLDENGKMMIPCKYRFVKSLYDKDLFYVETMEGGKVTCGAVDGTGKMKMPFNYKRWSVIIPEENFAIVEGQNEKFGVISLTGKVYMPTEYDDFFMTDSGYNLTKGNDTYFVDYKGNVKKE